MKPMKMMKETVLAFLGVAVLCLTGCASMDASGSQNRAAAEAKAMRTAKHKPVVTSL